MKHLELIRFYLPDRTVGEIDVNGISLATLERPWLANARNISCIPEGEYLIKRDKTGRHQWFSVRDVEGRSYIEIHGGVVPTHSDGCILVGELHDDSYNLKGSDVGLSALLRHVGSSDWTLKIRQFDPKKDSL